MEHQNEVQGTPEEVYDFLITSEELLDLPYPQSIEYLGILIDLSLDLGRVEGLEYAQRWAEGLATRELTSQQYALLHYFRSNTWANLAHLRRVSAQEQTTEDEETARIKVWGVNCRP